MAPDGFHHIEGVLVGGEEIRLYLYDDYTRPIRGDFTGRASATVRPGMEGSTPPFRGELAQVAGANYLALSLPTGTRAPLAVRMEIVFPGRDSVDIFDFEFDSPE